MEKATISQIKNHLSAYLKKVSAGVSVLILDRNRPVARLEKIEAGEYTDEWLVHLELRGLLRRPDKPVPMDLLSTPPPKAKRGVLRALLEERRQGR